MSDTIGIRELKNTLSAVLRRVKSGESVTVSERNRPIALIIPAATERSEQVLERLAEAGLLAWSGGKPAGCPRPPRISGDSVSDAVLEDRR